MTKLPLEKSDHDQGDIELSLEETHSIKKRGVPVRAKSGVVGYNPYDAVPSANPRDPGRKPTDLRKLSEWIRLQRQVEALKKAKPEPE